MVAEECQLNNEIINIITPKLFSLLNYLNSNIIFTLRLFYLLNYFHFL